MRRFEHGGDVYAHPGALDFSANLNPLGMPIQAKRALVEGIDAFERYPDPACRELTLAIARFERVDPGEVLACAGATDAFARICSTVGPEKALACAPCYSGYEQACVQRDIELLWHDLRREDGFRVTERLPKRIGRDVGLVFLANPNNPTGGCVDRDVVYACLARAREVGAVVVLDESFVDLSDGKGSNDLLKEFQNLVIVKALTKTFALAGLRVGYALCSDERLLSSLRAVGQPWAVSVPAQLAGVASLQDADYLAESRALVARERTRLADALLALGLRVLPSDTNFLLFEGPEGLHGQLLRQGILIRPCDNFRGLDEHWYRVAVRNPKENKQLIDAFSTISHVWAEDRRTGGDV